MDQLFAVLSSPSNQLKAFLLSGILCYCSNLSASTQASKSHHTTQTKPSQYSPQQISSALHWVTSPTDHNLCHGHYTIPVNILQNQQPKPMRDEITTTHSDGPGILKKGGVSIFNQNVVTTQPGRHSKADRVIIYRHSKTGKIRYVHMQGHVSLEEPNHRIIAKTANLNYDKNTQEFFSVLYRFYTQLKKQYYFTWGKAQHYFRDAQDNIVMKNATYTTCNPLNPSWHISATTLIINHQEHVGRAYNAFLYLHQIPVFYTPYFRFATAPIRKTGFLYPGLIYSSTHGMSYTFPFYWNMAPNYDDTITPIYYTNNGLMLNNTFRFLTSNSHGSFNSKIIFNDAIYNKFKKQQIDSHPSSDPEYIKALKSSGPIRGFFNFTDNTTFNSVVNANIILNYATDPYFLSDYNAPTTATSNTLQAQQLLNQASLNYNGQHWQASASLSGYQTLHQINVSASSQYRHLPELDAFGSYDHILGNNSLNLNAQYINFSYKSLFAPLTNDRTIGQRLHLQPQITHNFFNADGYIKPSFILDNVDYLAQLPITPANATRPAFNQSRNTPIASIDSGSYLLRQFHFSNHDYVQTLEPRIMYTYVPYRDQSQLPNFDTNTLPFSYNQIFSYNAFSGPDRIQNTNQLSLGLTSRLLTADDDSNILTANLGMINYFSPRRVCLSNSPCGADTDSFSPLVGMLTAYPATHWTVSGTAAWNFLYRDFDNAAITTSYISDGRHALNLGLDFVHAAPGSTAKNTNLISAGLAWPLGLHLTTLGYLYYDLSHQYSLTSLIGLQYDSCCWTLQAAYTQQYLNSTPNGSPGGTTNNFEHSISVQFMLKGLSTHIGSDTANTIISTGIPGYANPFLQP